VLSGQQQSARPSLLTELAANFLLYENFSQTAMPKNEQRESPNMAIISRGSRVRRDNKTPTTKATQTTKANNHNHDGCK